jgi:hypothetical protein
MSLNELRHITDTVIFRFSFPATRYLQHCRDSVGIACSVLTVLVVTFHYLQHISQSGCVKKITLVLLFVPYIIKSAETDQQVH